MTAQMLETAIVDAIIGLGIIAKPYPENPDKYIPDAYPGEALVRYEGTKYPARDISSVRADREQYIEIVVVGQQLRDQNGIYDMLERIRELLDGHTLENAGGHMELESESFMAEYNGTWQYGQRWRLKSNVEYEQRDDYAEHPIGD